MRLTLLSLDFPLVVLLVAVSVPAVASSSVVPASCPLEDCWAVLVMGRRGVVPLLVDRERPEARLRPEDLVPLLVGVK